MSIYEQLKDTRVLVTGHTGFKGSWLSLWLNSLQAKVTGYALEPKQNDDHYNLLGLSSEIVDIRGDVCNRKELSRVFDEAQPEIVLHLAAQAIVLDGYEHPAETFSTNIQGTVNVLDNCRLSNSVKAVVIITSDKCYHNNEWMWGYRENDRLGGYDPYSASKACAEIVTESYIKSFANARQSIGIASARAGNVIGGGDWGKNRIVPDCMRKLISGEDIIVRNPYSIRPWQHVLEPLSGYLTLAINLMNTPKQYTGAWNFGPEYESMKHVKVLVDKIITAWGSGRWVQEEQESAPHEAKNLFLDITKAKDILKWKPVWDFDETIGNTVHWYKNYASGANITDLSSNQIDQFMMRLK